MPSNNQNLEDNFEINDNVPNVYNYIMLQQRY